MPTITSQPISLASADGNNFTAVIPNIPHYSVVAISLPDGVSPTPTPTPTISPTPTPSPTPTISPTPAPVPVASDTFNRPNQTYWGTSSDGHVWTGDASSSNVFAIINASGRITPTTSIKNAILGPQLQDAEAVTVGIAHNYSNTKLGVLLRYVDGNNNYLAYIDGTRFVIQKKFKGAPQSLTGMSFSANGLSAYKIRFRAQGSALSAKVWPANTKEPPKWMLNATDTTFTSGFAGLHFYSQTGSSATFTSFLLSSF